MSDLKHPFEEDKFNKIYHFIISTTGLILVYLAAVSFVPISVDNRDNVKTILIYLLGYMSANGGFLTSGNAPANNKKPDTTVTGDSPTVNVQPQPDGDKKD
jgi:hypothetical protein